MEKDTISQDKIRSQAGYVLYKTKMLIRLCNSILPEEEGRRNMSMRFRERAKARRKAMILEMMNKFIGVFDNRRRYE